MTRINSNLDPSILLDQHLMAEYRELPMVFAALKRSLRTKTTSSILESIPKKYTLGSGHVTFFYDKLLFLEKRYDRLILQLRARGYNLDANRHTYNSNDYPAEFLKDCDSTIDDDRLVVKRIREKYDMKPEWYKYFGEKVDHVVFDCLYRQYN